MSRTRKTRRKSERRQRALATVASVPAPAPAAPTTPARPARAVDPTTVPTAEATTPSTVRRPAPRRRRGFAPWLLAIFLLGIAVVVLGVLLSNESFAPASASAPPSVIVGEPGGVVVTERPPSPTATAISAEASTPIAEPANVPTPSPTPAPVAAEPPVPTPAPAPPATTPPAEAAPTPQPSLEPTAATVAVAAPDDSVAAFYGHVTAGEFDAAHALWSESMKATYPRQANLDDRFADTASITFDQLSVVEQAERTAVVQANFTEVYDSGARRSFVGYWQLVLVDGRWLLDEPHY